MSGTKTQAHWLIDAVSWSVGRFFGIFAVSAAYAIYLMVKNLEKTVPDSVLGQAIYACIAFMIAMAVVDVVTVQVREKPVGVAMTVTACGTLAAMMVSAYYGATLGMLALFVIGSIPQFLLGTFRMVMFQGRMSLDGTPPEKDEPWPLYILRGRRVMTKRDFIAPDVKRPHAARFEPIYAYVMDTVHAEDQPVSLFGNQHRFEVTLFVVWVELDYNGTFRVTWEPKIKWLAVDQEHPLDIVRLLGVKASDRVQTILECSGDDVVAFSWAPASAHLGQRDANLFRQGRLLYQEHDTVRVELRHREPVTILRDFFFGKSGAENVVVRLTNNFKPPSDGWDSVLKKPREAYQADFAVKRNQEAAKTFWNGEALVPVVANGWKLSPPVDVPLHEGAMKALLENKLPQLLMVSADKVGYWSEAKPNVWHDGDTVTSCYSSAYLPYMLSCVISGQPVEFRATTNVFFYPPSYHLIYKHTGDTVRVEVVTETSHRMFIVQLSKVTDYKIARAGDLRLPDNYFIRRDAVKSDDTLVPYIECSDGVIVPLAYTTKTPRAILEQWVVTLKKAQATCHQPQPKEGGSQARTQKPVSEEFDPI